MSEQYFTPDQQEFIRKRREIVGEDRIRQVEQHEWPTLIAEVKAEMDKGTDPSSARARDLAKRWKDPNPAERHGMPLTREMFEYIGKVTRE